MSKEGKRVSTTLNYIEHFFILASTVTGCISISAFASLIGIPLGIASSVTGLKICAIAAWIKNQKSMIKKNKNKPDKVVLLAKSKLNKIEVSFSKALIGLNISHDEFLLINNMLKEYTICRLYKIFLSIYKTILSYCLKCKKKIQKLQGQKTVFVKMCSLW